MAATRSSTEVNMRSSPTTRRTCGPRTLPMNAPTSAAVTTTPNHHVGAWDRRSTKATAKVRNPEQARIVVMHQAATDTPRLRVASSTWSGGSGTAGGAGRVRMAITAAPAYTTAPSRNTQAALASLSTAAAGPPAASPATAARTASRPPARTRSAGPSTVAGTRALLATACDFDRIKMTSAQG